MHACACTSHNGAHLPASHTKHLTCAERMKGVFLSGVHFSSFLLHLMNDVPLRVCVCVCVCMYLSIHIRMLYIYIYIHTHTHKHIRKYTCYAEMVAIDGMRADAFSRSKDEHQMTASRTDDACHAHDVLSTRADGDHDVSSTRADGDHDVSSTRNDLLLGGCTLYVTCEPCIMCASALSLLGVARVVFG